MSLRFPWLAPERREVDPGFLIVVGSHGFPPTRARFARASELAWQIARRGAPVDVLVLVERLLQPFEEDELEGLKRTIRRLDIEHHPRTSLGVAGLAHRALDRFPWKRLGGAAHIPWTFRHRLASFHAPRGYRGVIVQGVHLAPCLSLFPAWTEKIIGIERIGSESHREHERHGFESELDVFADAARELELLGTAAAVIVSCVADAVTLREKGFGGDMVLAPPLAAREGRPFARPDSSPLRPPRILAVGSATTANADGIDWFRKNVLPRVVEAHPALRLRIVGEVARRAEPGPGVDRIGWVEDISEEYRNAAVVALPLRMGSGLHRRAVEALSHRKVLAATIPGAHGTGMVAGRDGIVSDDPGILAAKIMEVISSDAERLRIEGNAAALAAERFDPERAHGHLAERLGLPDLVCEAPVPSKAASLAV